MQRLELKGMPISNGVGMGKICVFEQTSYEVNKGKIKESQIGEEINRLEVAIDKTLYEISDLSNDLRKRLEEEGNLIFEAYKAILEDRYFIQEIKDIVAERKCFAENAVDTCIENYAKAIENSDNEYVKQSIYDIKDIGARIIKNIIGGKNVKLMLDEVDNKKIVAVEHLTPWLAAALGKKNVMGIVSNEGAAYLSHSAIILRGLGIPTINNIDYHQLRGFNNNFAIIDGHEGVLLVNPEKQEIAKYKDAFKNKIISLKELFKKKNKPAITLDGRKVGVLANIGNFEECDTANSNDVDGIGLVRTEILFINYKEMPDEKEQYSLYSKIIKKMRPKPIVLRTVDAGEDKILAFFTTKMSMSNKDLRGIRFSLAQHEQFYAQIKAILRASELGNVSIMFPMVNNVEEIKEAKNLIEKADKELYQGKNYSKNLKIGAVLETKLSVDNIDDILSEVDFISIGTNDLLQSFSGLSRKTSVVEDYNYLNPEFLKVVKYCIDKANEKSKNVCICGEMASDPLIAIVLLGMGVTDLSVHPTKVSSIKEVVRKVHYKEAKALTDQVLAMHNKEDVMMLLSVELANIL